MKKNGLFLILCFISCHNLWGICKEKVKFKNGDIELAGTLYFPKGKGPFPAVVFVHGSGPETRKNSRYSAKWMASIGYIALTYDKRGTGKSGGTEEAWNRFSFDDLAGDVQSAVHFLSQLEKVDKTQIGLHASSQGAWVASLATTKTNLINFMIVKSASVTTVAEDRIFERAARLKRENFSDIDIAEAQKMQLVESKLNDQENDDFVLLFEQYKNRPWFPRVYGSTTNPSSLEAYRKWYATIAGFNPVPYLEQSDIPAFWIFGDSQIDQLATVTESINTLEKLKSQGKKYKIMSYQGEGHQVSERKYEQALHKWLAGIHGERGFKFKRH